MVEVQVCLPLQREEWEYHPTPTHDRAGFTFCADQHEVVVEN